MITSYVPFANFQGLFGENGPQRDNKDLVGVQKSVPWWLSLLPLVNMQREVIHVVRNAPVGKDPATLKRDNSQLLLHNALVFLWTETKMLLPPFFSWKPSPFVIYIRSTP